MIAQHLLVLLVVLPLIGAPLCLLLPSGRAAWLLAVAINGLVWWGAVLALQHLLTVGPLHYALGGWAEPWGIAYRLDLLNGLLVLLIGSVSWLVVIYAGPSASNELRATRITGFYGACLLIQSGLLGICITADVFNLFVFLEISALASYILISLGRERRALIAAYQYLILGTIGATFMLIGIGLLYAMTGTLNMADLALRLADVQGARSVHTAFAFIVVGLAIKLALFPLHQWLPNAYAFAPSAVSALLAAVATKVAIYALLRFVFTVFGVVFVFQGTPFGWVLLALALAGILSGSWLACFQRNAKRLLAYSSVTQIGYMVLGLSMASLSGLTASILHLLNHALIKGGLFMALGCVVYRLGSAELDQMRGVGRQMPWTMAAFVLGGLSLIGVPLTAGFVSKWMLLSASLERGWWPVTLFILAATLMAVIYIGRVVEVAYFRPPASAAEGQTPPARGLKEAPLILLIPTWLLVMANIYLGVDTRLTLGLASLAAAEVGAGLETIVPSAYGPAAVNPGVGAVLP